MFRQKVRRSCYSAFYVIDKKPSCPLCANRLMTIDHTTAGSLQPEMTLLSPSTFERCAQEKAVEWSKKCLNAIRAGNHEDALSCGKNALSLQPGNPTVKEAVALLEQLLGPDSSDSESGSDEGADGTHEDVETSSNTSESSSESSSVDSEVSEQGNACGDPTAGELEEAVRTASSLVQAAEGVNGPSRQAEDPILEEPMKDWSAVKMPPMTQERRQLLRATRAKLAAQVEHLRVQAQLASTSLHSPADASLPSTSKGAR